MNDTARVVVIGGGIVGCGVLYYLAELGWSDVALFESGELASGTTWGSSALVTHLTSRPFISRLHRETLDLYPRLAEETDQSTGLHLTGSLRLATTRERMTEYKRYLAQAPFQGHAFHLIGPDEIRTLHPLVDTDGVLGAAYTPDDGYVEPTSATNAFAAGAVRRGATIHRRCPVRDLAPRRGGGWEVVTDQGSVRADVVVNAAGMWAPVISAMVGASSPVVAMERQYFVTEALPALADLDRELPVLRDPDGPFYLRQEGDALLVGPYERTPRFWDVEAPPLPGGQDNLPPFLDDASEPIASAIGRVPVIGELGVRSVINVPTSRSPDGNPLVGPVAGLDKFFIAAGFFAGLSEVSVCRYLAQWIVDGEPGIDLWPFDCRRFGAFANKRYARARVRGRHIVGLTQAISYPGEELSGGRPARTSPLHHRLERLGAVFGQRFGWEYPTWFAPQGVDPVDSLSFERRNWFPHVARECRAVGDRAGVLDFSDMAKFEVSGPAAERFLDRMCANRLPGVGEIVTSPMLSPAGRIVCLVCVTRLAEDRFYLTAEPEAELHHHEWMRRHLPAGGGVRLDTVTTRTGVLVVSGPRSGDLLCALSGDHSVTEGFATGTFREVNAGLAVARALNRSTTGEAGWELHLPIECLAGVYDALERAGEDHGLANIGFRAFESLRIEAGERRWGHEIGAGHTPVEVGLAHLVCADKGGFIGLDAFLAAREAGPERSLACLTVEADRADCWGGEPVLDGDRPIALVSTGGYGHRTGKSLALAYLPVEAAVPGTALAIEILGERRSATVVAEPFFKIGA
jgi:dimethylglycine dehydrogenase